MRPVSEVVRQLAGGWVDDEGKAMPAQEINSGDCGNFAESLVEMLVEEGYDGAHHLDNECVELGAEDHDHEEEIDCAFCEHWHVWSWVNGRYYDAEAPDGVEDWVELPFWKRWSAKIEIQRRNTRTVERRMREVTAELYVKLRGEFRAEKKQKARA